MRLTVLLLCFICFCYGVAFAGDVNSVVVTVNGENLIAAELNQEVQKLVPMEASYHGGMSAEKIKNIQSKALATLVEKELQYQDGLARGVKLDSEAVDESYKRVIENYSSRKEFNKAIEKAGFTEKLLKRFIARDLLSEKIRKQEVDDKVRITEATIAEYYETNKNRYMKPEEYRASTILVKVDPSSNTEERAKLKERAESLMKKVKEGADFGQLAYDNSDDMSRIKGGDTGYFHLGRMVQEFEEAVKKLKVGEVSGIVESMYGYHIIKLTDKKAPRQLPYEEVKDKIRTQLVEKEKKRLFDEWMGGLRSKAKIVYPGKG
ncbi:MAG: hypothetical protein CXR31_07240 [Geobacter sp.]|nr:MAG: hypothetical protein CXR31_07240 [Geobacter sp.]